MRGDYKELKKLKRTEILELLLEVTKRNEELENTVLRLEEQLNSRNIVISEAGSIAQAALNLNKIFESAQLAADQYLESVKNLANNETASALGNKADEE